MFRVGLQGGGCQLPCLHRVPARPAHCSCCCCCTTLQNSTGGNTHLGHLHISNNNKAKQSDNPHNISKWKNQVPMLILSTAHYSKFWDDLEPLVPIGQAEVKRPSVHQGIQSCLKKPVVHRLLKVSYFRIPQYTQPTE